MKTILPFALALCLSACSTGVVAMGPRTYMVAVDAGPGLSDGWSAMARASREASAFCAKQGLVMVPVSEDVRPAVYAGHTASARLMFRAVPPGDPETRHVNPIVKYHDEDAGQGRAALAAGLSSFQEGYDASMDRYQRQREIREQRQWRDDMLRANQPRSYQLRNYGGGNVMLTPN